MFNKIKKNTSQSIEQNKKTFIYDLSDKLSSAPSIWSKIYYKEYPRFPSFLLFAGKKLPKRDFFETLLNRSSERKYNNKTINSDTLSQLLFVSAGITRIDTKNNIHKRSYPSGGARYPLEIYPIIMQGVSELPAGIYHYAVKTHKLELLKEGIFRNEIKKFTGKINEDVVNNCSILFVITAVFNRNEIKYGNRSYRYTLIECGHLAQNMCLASSALDLHCCPIGGFIDKSVNEFLSIEEKKEQSIYMISVG